MLHPTSTTNVPTTQNVLTTGQLMLMEKKQKLYKDTQRLPLWNIRKIDINPRDKNDLNKFSDNQEISLKYTVRKY